ncbi:MAG TPA: serine acetyltransferase [Armatimonadota bacterium]|nr:serine acetyltransferase [Armatimonadota bacterium]HQK93762.1 serine acetyltransferase [Armatimonadota bacterium]
MGDQSGELPTTRVRCAPVECLRHSTARCICEVTTALLPSYVQDGSDVPMGASGRIPSLQHVVQALHCLQDVLFPGRMSSELTEQTSLEAFVEERLSQAYRLLLVEVEKALPFRWTGALAASEGKTEPMSDARAEANRITAEFLTRIPAIRAMLVKDVEAAYRGDPAATTYAEIMVSYPGLKAITTHRIAHELYRLQVPLIPRIMSEHAHSHTGIDIHPGAEIGESFFIDHGTGVVIGETCEIGRNVKLYQGVTLGARSFKVADDGTLVKGIKRHPTLEDDVVVYANATILGGDTVIGKGAVIGSSVWILSSVPPGATVVIRDANTEVRTP